LAGICTRAASDHVADKSPFRVDRFSLQNNSQTVSNRPLTIHGPTQRWSYAVIFPNELPPIKAAMLGPVEVVVHAKVLSGRLSVGLVGHDLKSFITQRDIEEPSDITITRLVASNLADVSAIVCRSGDSDAKLIFSIVEIAIERTSTTAETPPPRGFREKSAIADLTRLASRPVRTIFDVGANVGDMTGLFASSFPDAAVHAFEPNPHVAARLRQRFDTEPRVVINQCALGAATSRIDLYSYSNTAISSLIPVAPDGASFMDGEIRLTERIPVSVDTIDRYLEANGIESLDIMKIDTQGYERAVLEGAASALASRRIRFILAEILFVPLYENQTSYADLLFYLWNSGYELVDFYDFVYDTNGHVKWGDGLFRPR